MLSEQPLLYIIFVFHLYGNSVDVDFLYSHWHYDTKIETLRSMIRKMVHKRICALLEAIFCGFFNVHPDVTEVNSEKWRKWVCPGLGLL